MGSYLEHHGISEQQACTLQDPLNTYLRKYLIQGLSPTESNVHLIARRCLQVSCLVLACGGKYPFVAINLKLGGDNIIYGGALTWGNVTSYATLLAWALLNMIDDYSGPAGSEEKQLRQRRMGCTNSAILASAIAIGVISEVPFAYLAYEYNNHNLIMPSIMFASDSWVPIYSTDLSIRKFVQQRNVSKLENELILTRNKIIRFVENNQQFLKGAKNARMDYVKALANIKNIQDSQHQHDKYIELLTQKKIDQQESSSRSLKIAQKTISFMGLTLTASHMIFIGYMGFEGAKLMWDNPYADAVAAGVVVGANVYLEGLSIPRTAVRIFDMIKDIVSCSYKPTLSEQFAPKLSFAFKAISLGTAALAYGPSIQICRDYFDGPLSIYMQITVSSAVILFVSTALLDITDQIVEDYVAIRGSEEAKQILTLNKQMQRFCRLLKESPLLEYARFMKTLPQECFDELIEDTKITLENLNNYISEHLDPDNEESPLLLNDCAAIAL